MRYVWRDGAFRNPTTNEAMQMPHRDGICMPNIVSDITEYLSPIDGTLIGSRSTRRYDLEKNDCVEMPPPKKRRGYRNPTFAKKRGLPLNESGS